VFIRFGECVEKFCECVEKFFECAETIIPLQIGKKKELIDILTRVSYRTCVCRMGLRRLWVVVCDVLVDFLGYEWLFFFTHHIFCEQLVCSFFYGFEYKNLMDRPY
jgi:hypothetical protein